MRGKIYWLVFSTLILVLLLACGNDSTTLSSKEKDQVDIYAAAIRQVYTVDHTFGDNAEFPVVYLLRATNDGVGDPDITQTSSVIIPEPIQESIVAVLDDLPADFSWVDSRDDVPIDSSTGVVERDGVIITLGNLHFEDDDRVLVSASIYIADLAAGGQTYVIEKLNGTWRVTGDTGVRWIS